MALYKSCFIIDINLKVRIPWQLLEKVSQIEFYENLPNSIGANTRLQLNGFDMTSTEGIVFLTFIRAAYLKLILIWRIFNEIKKIISLCTLLSLVWLA
jgi:hypothetical protein